jgi:DNA replication protein DnaC
MSDSGEFSLPIPRPCQCRRDEINQAIERDRQRPQREREEAIKRISKAYLDTLPRGLHNARVNNFEVIDSLGAEEKQSCKAAKAATADYIRGLRDNIRDGKGAIFFGNTGTGKSHLAAAIGSAAVAQGYSARFANAQDLITELRGCSFGDTSEVMLPLKHCTTLIFDDLGAEWISESGWTLAQINELVKYRNSARKPTIFTTNLTPSEMEERYAGRTADCIFENDLNRAIKIACKSYRRNRP